MPPRENQWSDDVTSPTFIQALARGLSVIRAMGQAAAPVTIAEAAGATGLTRAGARRILLTLEQLGYVRLKGRHFSLTPRIMELGSAFHSSDILWSIAEPYLESLAADTLETASAGVLDDLDVVYVLRVKPARKLHIDIGPGARLPAHVSSMGRVLLAAQPPRALDQYFRRARIERYTPHTIVDEKSLRRVIAQASEQGYSIVAGEMDETILGISVPVRNPAGAVVAAINISSAQARVTPERAKAQILPKLRSVAAGVEAMLRLDRRAAANGRHAG